MPAEAPRIETSRLVMRAHRGDDLDDCVALWSDPQVVRHIGGHPFTEEQVWAKLLRYVGHWPVLGYGYWVVEEKASGRFVGEVGFADFRRQMTPSLDGAPEAGWVLAPWAHGRGYATEALAAATSWLEGRLGKVRTVCIIDEDNAASIRVATKAGYTEWVRTELSGTPVVLFERSPAAE
jgi:RimJ/RimL family protein N-acetyltransferase